jgi:thioredoxin reductase (NADPH)
MRDVIIIGAGAAGLSAALVLSRARLSVLVLDAGEPRNAAAAHLHGFVSRDGMAPAEFLAVGRREVLGYGGLIVAARVNSIERRGARFDVTTDDGSVEVARAVLVATGLRDEVIGIPGLWDRWGTTVHHCPYCHGQEVRDQEIVVIGGPAPEVSAKQAGLLRRYSDRVTLVASRPSERLEAFGVRVIDGTVVMVDDASVALADGSLLPYEAIFVSPVPRANDDLLRSLGCAHTENGLIAVDGAGQTSVEGVWAAGNVVTPTAQLISAAGGASVSAIAINGWLLQEDMDAALAHSINRKELP